MTDTLSSRAEVAALLSGAMAQVTGEVVTVSRGRLSRVFQAIVTGTGAVAATVIIEGCIDAVHFKTLATITLTDNDVDSDEFVSDGPWPFVRARLTAISGTDAAVDVYMGVA